MVVHLTIWTSVALYTLSRLFETGRVVTYALAWLLAVVHIVLALVLVHHGSQTEAFEHTATRTFEAIGWRWGGGLVVNYAFMLLWSFDVLSWLGQRKFRSELRPRWGVWWHALVWFMLLNAAVLFARPEARIWGVAVCLLLLSPRCWRRPAHSIAS